MQLNTMKTESKLSLKWNKAGSMCSFTQQKFFFPWRGEKKKKENTKEKLLMLNKNKSTKNMRGFTKGNNIQIIFTFKKVRLV